MKQKRGLVYLWTGHGAGKTTSALGVALRSIGHGKKVVVIQFLKGRKDIGEYKIKERLKPEYEIYQFGRSKFINPKNPDPEDYMLAKKGLEFARKKLKEKPFLMILDEINLITGPKKIQGINYNGLVDVNEVIDLLDEAPPETTIYLTGRYAPKKLIDRADFATEIKEIKHPIGDGISARKGIEY
ncbi:MAG: cob(I)yrinic acid a,c-diamide adenosyltransferase [Candidatus Aenigmarchaeota archaeon]|nr:cob(I)yrinic acid a,c-diamide adenosyltransferase [Candidatus Aenigmarchaeota archaeon]